MKAGSAQASDGYRWRILGLAVLAQAAFAAALQGLPVLGPQLTAEYGLSAPELGLLLSAIAAGMLVTMLAWGILADRIGERAVIAAGLLCAAAALAAAALAVSVVALGSALFVAGMFGASVNAASGKAVASWFAPHERGLAMGIRQTALPAGAALASLALPVITGVWSLSAALLALALIAAVAGLVNLLLLRPAPSASAGREVPAAGPPAGGRSATGTLHDRRIWRLGFASLLLMYAQWSMLAFLVLHLTAERGLTVGFAAICLASVQLGGAAGRIVAGRWSDRLGMRVAPLRTLAIAIAIAFVVASGAGAGADVVAVPLLLGAGLLAISWNGLSFAAAAELAGVARSGTALGLQNTALALGAVIAPPIYGVIISEASWGLGLLTVAALAATAAWVLGPLDERRRSGRLSEIAATRHGR